MEEKRLNEKESLELITQMIQNTQNRMEQNAGAPFLIWGYTTVIISLAMWYVLHTTHNCQWQWCWFLLPLIGWGGTAYSVRKSKNMVKTYVDRIINYVWTVFGIAGFLVSCISIIHRLPILFLILLLMGMGTMLTGMIIRFKVVTICGLLGALSSIACLWIDGIDQILMFAPTFIFMMIIPGHILNAKGKNTKK